MSGWQTGRAAIDDLLNRRALQQLPAATRSAASALARARQLLSSAAILLDTDPDSAYVLAYDAARQAGTAVLARPRTPSHRHRRAHRRRARPHRPVRTRLRRLPHLAPAP